MSDSLSVLEKLQVRATCEALIYTYVRLLDSGDLDAAAMCFAEEGALARPMNPQQLIQGRDAIRESLHARPASLMTRHLATNVVIEVESQHAARGVSSLTMIACTRTTDQGLPIESSGPIYFGEFRDRFVCRDGTWMFLERRGSIQMKY